MKRNLEFHGLKGIFIFKKFAYGIILEEWDFVIFHLKFDSSRILLNLDQGYRVQIVLDLNAGCEAWELCDPVQIGGSLCP